MSNHVSTKSLIAAALILTATMAAAMPIPVATYNFNGTLAADELGASALTAIDPLGLNHFRTETVTETVFGIPRTVYRFDGSNFPVTDQVGLVLTPGTLLSANDAYSVELILRFYINSSSWENIFGVSNRTSDNAFYVAPQGQLQVWPNSLGPNIVTQNVWHHIIMTNDGNGVVAGFLDGVFNHSAVPRHQWILVPTR